MNKIEYAAKVYIKQLLALNFSWFTFAITAFNLTLIASIALLLIQEHGTQSAAEMNELASSLELVILLVWVWPLIFTGIYLTTKFVMDRYDIEERELWREVDLP